MTKRILKLEINCGEKTCYAESGVGCQFVRAWEFNKAYFCAIWGKADNYTIIQLKENSEGWLLRRPECLDTAK